MAAPRFAIAKYISDPQRMEPRNIGVILWSDGAVRARFVGESLSGNNLDEHAPRFVGPKNRKVYAQWVNFWRRNLSKGIVTSREGVRVDKSDAGFLDALRSKSRENFVLVDGGVLLDQVSANDLDDVVDYLFEKLVGEVVEDKKDQEFRVLRRGWSKVLSATGLRRRSDFRERYPLTCQIAGVRREFHFDNAIGNGVPDALFQRTLLHRDESVNSTFLMLEAVAKQGILPKSRCAAIVHVGLTDTYSENVATALEMLRLHGTVINVDEPENALNELDSMGLPPPLDH